MPPSRNEPCETIETGAAITRAHNGRCVTVSNSKRREIGVVSVDGCLISDESKRVDWLIRIPARKKLRHGVQCVKLVELKGSDVIKAFAQLTSTIQHSAVASERHLIDGCYVVSQVSPQLSTAIQVAVFQFRATFNVPVFVVSHAQIDASD
jgi:hypothetical protein